MNLPSNSSDSQCSHEHLPGPGRKTRLAVSSLNQWVHDYAGNGDRIIKSMTEAREQGAKLWVGQELGTTGYNCEDGFGEADTIYFAWEVIGNILCSDQTQGLLSAVGLPVVHQGVRYNATAFLLNKKIIGLRPKMDLANEGNYREQRYFASWKRRGQTENFRLPSQIGAITEQTTVPIGDFAIETADGAVLAGETCEELFTLNNPGIKQALDGVEINVNQSGSEWKVQKLQQRIQLMCNQTAKGGGIYAYSNGVGCDGATMLMDGSPVIIENGQIRQIGPAFSMQEVNTVVATVDLENVQNYRASIASFREQASNAEPYPRVSADLNLMVTGSTAAPVPRVEFETISEEAEILQATALWLWDYLRRTARETGATGYFLPLSGGIDSSAVATCVGSMCRRVMAEVAQGNQTVIDDVRLITDNSDLPQSSQELAYQIFVTAYQGSAGVSSPETQQRASHLAAEIGSFHLETKAIGELLKGVKGAVQAMLGSAIQFESEGGSRTQDLALQNIQARERMVVSYAIAQLVQESRQKKGWLLVLGAGNADEQKMGYATKYDAGSADVDPIGSINKQALGRFMQYAADKFGYTTLTEVIAATPTAELQPTSEEAAAQSDEEDIGLSYHEQEELGELHLSRKLGPLSMFRYLATEADGWGPGTQRNLSYQAVAERVKRYWERFREGRHKAWVGTPALHARPDNPDVHRHNLRPLITPSRNTYEFKAIDKAVEQLTSQR